MKLAYIASEFGIFSRFENNDTPTHTVIVAAVAQPPGIYVVHNEVISSIGPQKNPKPINTNMTIKSLLTGGSFESGQMSPCRFT